MIQRGPLPNMDPILKQTLNLAYRDPRSGRDITEAAGVNHNTIYHWKTRGGAQLVTLVAVLGALGYELKIVKKPRKQSTEKPSAPTRTLRIEEVLSGMFGTEETTDAK